MQQIRIVELFAGYGSQSFALDYLGLDFEHWRICEWAVKSIQAYKDAHFPNDDIECNLNKEQLVDYLYSKGISFNYDSPATREQINRKKESELVTIWKNIQITNNLVNIQQVKGADLGITDTKDHTYLITYSFPCQDLSVAGKGKGMADTSTRSGMLWEVERILYELNELPQILLMENVPQVCGSKNKVYFDKWCASLEKLGYKNYYKNLIATDYGIPQTRKRTFMVSILGDAEFTFPEPIPLEKKLKDFLEPVVDEKYYLSKRMIEGMSKTNYESYKLDNKMINKDGNAKTILASFGRAPQVIQDESFFTETQEKMFTEDGNVKRYINSDIVDEFNPGDAADISYPNGYGKGNRVQKQMSPTLTVTGARSIVVKEPTLKEQLCNELVQSNIVKDGDVVNHSYTNGLCGKNPNSRQTLEDYVETTNGLSPTLTTRPDCLGVAVGTNNLRIRKLTPRECFRLMGVRDNDFENIARNQSDSSLYHLAGDSIVINVLMAIFKELFKGENND